jgi:hypothetical protein
MLSQIYGTVDVNVDKLDFSYSPGHDYAIAVRNRTELVALSSFHHM